MNENFEFEYLKIQDRYAWVLKFGEKYLRFLRVPGLPNPLYYYYIISLKNLKKVFLFAFIFSRVRVISTCLQKGSTERIRVYILLLHRQTCVYYIYIL